MWKLKKAQASVPDFDTDSMLDVLIESLQGWGSGWMKALKMVYADLGQVTSPSAAY